MLPAITTSSTHVWRFGYGSNIGLEILRQKKNLNPAEYHVGTIQGWDLFFKQGIAFVEPGWGAVRPDPQSSIHGSAFLIPKEEAELLDRQEGGYNVQHCQFISYEGGTIEDVGMYVPKKLWTDGDEEGVPSLRYLRLLQNGARDGKLTKEWIDRIDSQPYYITPPEVRKQTMQWISEFDADPERRDSWWTAEDLAKYDGASSEYPAHTSVMQYVIKIHDVRVFSSWKGHSITRRNLIQFRGMSLDTNDIRFGEEGFRPIPKLSECSEEEREFLMQNLESLLHRGGGATIVGQLKDFVEDQGDV
mmetsp:Transcript_13130/g.19682  ORF Transcript_13130/g.19682 Transcript_13130/m.19682 type:complete len:303 (+) Transcript_13130:155-1063(+)